MTVLIIAHSTLGAEVVDQVIGIKKAKELHKMPTVSAVDLDEVL